MDNLNARDYIHIGVTLFGFIATIVSLKVDLQWMKQWCRDHKEEDERQFDEVKADIRELRKQKAGAR